MALNNYTQAQTNAIASVENLKNTIYSANTYNNDLVVLIGPGTKSERRAQFLKHKIKEIENFKKEYDEAKIIGEDLVTNQELVNIISNKKVLETELETL